jgi:hypothetical protein
MTTAVNPIRSSIVCLTDLQQTLWQLGLPILDSKAVAEHKKRAKRSMLWHAIRSPLLGMTALVAFECLGRDPHRAGMVGAAVVVLATLFAWLVYAYDLQWTVLDYKTYQSLSVVPAHVAAAADALVQCGVAQSRIGVEFLKNDPILFVKEGNGHAAVKRYDLIVW